MLNSWFIIEDNYNNAREDDDPAVCPESEIIVRILSKVNLKILINKRQINYKIF